MLQRWLKYGCALAAFLVITGVAMPRSAAAQAVDFAAGYSFLHDNELSENFARGFFASLGVSANSWLGFVGEIHTNRKDYDAVVDDVTLNVDFYGGGVRFRGSSGAARPYGQILVGAARGRIAFLGEAESGTEFAWQPGAGVDAYFSRSVGLRFGINGRFIQGEDVTAKEVQVIIGVVFGGR